MKLDSLKAKAEPIKNKAKRLGTSAFIAANGMMFSLAANPVMALAEDDGLDKLKTTLGNIASAGGFLCIFAALVLFAMGKLGDGNGARGEGMMVGLALAAIAFFAAALFIGGVDFTITV